MSRPEAQKRTPAPQWDRDDLLPYDHRDQFCDLPDGTGLRICSRGGKENYSFFHSSGSRKSYNGGKSPKHGESNAGSGEEHFAENSCSSVNTSEMKTFHNGNICTRGYGDINSNFTHDQHKVEAKNTSNFTNGQKAEYVGGSKVTNVKGDNSSGQTQGEAGNKGGRGYSIAANRVMMNADSGAFQISTGPLESTGGGGGSQSAGGLSSGGGTLFALAPGAPEAGNPSMRSFVASVNRGATHPGGGVGTGGGGQSGKEPGDIHMNSGRKWEAVSKSDQNQRVGGNWNGEVKGKIDHESQQDALYTSNQDMVHAVPNSFQYLGQMSKQQKEGCFVLTVCGPAKKVKALA